MCHAKHILAVIKLCYSLPNFNPLMFPRKRKIHSEGRPEYVNKKGSKNQIKEGDIEMDEGKMISLVRAEFQKHSNTNKVQSKGDTERKRRREVRGGPEDDQRYRGGPGSPLP